MVLTIFSWVLLVSGVLRVWLGIWWARGILNSSLFLPCHPLYFLGPPSFQMKMKRLLGCPVNYFLCGSSYVEAAKDIWPPASDNFSNFLHNYFLFLIGKTSLFFSPNIPNSCWLVHKRKLFHICMLVASLHSLYSNLVNWKNIIDFCWDSIFVNLIGFWGLNILSSW